MMADEVKRHGNRKRKRGSMRRKLLVNQRVEVRSMEEGFLGSWHPGTIIRCGKQKRHVRYDNVLDDGGLNYLEDEVNVSTVLDGIGFSSDCYNRRGLIRPFPPSTEFSERDLPFGQCVDVSYQEAWWEGVIFDHCNGMEERRAFFPDLGDEMKVGIHQLRITQDWDEDTGTWEPRGKWVFLELFEDFEREYYIAVSVKQIWYDVRNREDFDNIKDWTCNVKDLWRDLVMDVIGDYYTLTLEEIFPALNLPSDFLKATPKLMSVEHTDNNVNCDANHKNLSGSDSPVENCDAPNLLDADKNCGSTTPVQEKQGSDGRDPLVDGASEKDNLLPENENPSHEADEAISGASSLQNSRKRRRSSSISWQPLILTEDDGCTPDVIDQYLNGFASKTIRDLLKDKVRQYLAHLGWKVEWTQSTQFPDQRRYRYKSPDTKDTKVYNSILKVCKLLRKNSMLSQNDHNRMHSSIDGNISQLLSVQPQNGEHSPALVEPEFCPQAVVKYYLHALENQREDKRKWKLKAMKHLLAEGWIFDYPTKERRTTFYKSPQNQCLGNLRGACRVYIKDRIPKWTTSGMGPSNVAVNNEKGVGHVASDDFSQCVSQLLEKDPELLNVDGLRPSRSTENRNHRTNRNSKSSSRKRHSDRVATRVLRSSKRVQKVSAPCPSHQRPQNVLAWLIDSNMVTPRCKVYCRVKGGRKSVVAEGRITREGIKCSCCQKTYGISGFANHASGGTSDCTPSSSIFMKNGRTLLDCMIQVMRDHRTKETTEEPCIDLCEGENDNVCSICNFGGSLMLCDQCPSAFHTKCLGLKRVPDGDWFCPSCRCEVCCHVKFEGTEDGHFLTCIQCEHKYHVGCLSKRKNDESRRYQEHWVCGKECEQIYADLHNLLGKPVSVGDNGLTWTLMKFDNVGSTTNGLLAETYSKLSVALSVMHECFEPLENPFSTRDITDDVIFNKRSELNRLNFQGFYTVLLEKNEELISVANIRIFGRKVAELPLVGTRIQYRRLGMCRVLMDQLEKKLMQLGVERLVLPAVPGVLDTWTNSFGFAKMTNFERAQFLDCPFLDFQGTFMCQKRLKRIPSPDSSLTRDRNPKPREVLSVKCRIDFDKSSPVSEVNQAEEIVKKAMANQKVVENVSEKQSVRNKVMSK